MPEEDYTPAEVVRSLKRIEADLAEVKSEVRQQAAGYIARAEYETWKAAIGREVNDIKTNLTAARTPWPVVGGFALSALMGIVTLIVLLSDRGVTP